VAEIEVVIIYGCTRRVGEMTPPACTVVSVACNDVHALVICLRDTQSERKLVCASLPTLTQLVLDVIASTCWRVGRPRLSQ